MNRPLHVLIVDDDELIRLIVRAVVERAGMTAAEAADGAEALSRLSSSEQFDLVMLDLEMPGVGGLDVLRRLQAGGGKVRPAILILTGSEGKDVEEARALGASGILAKPIVAERLLDRIREVVPG